MPNYKTCNYLYDDGHTCKSPAVTRRDYCVFHLRDRASQLRAAQYRARSQRFNLQLPPLENMHAVQSAISRVLQAIAADMIDPKRAHEILTGLRHAASNFKNPAAWQHSAYADNPSEAPAIEYNNLESEYGLPDGLDINTPPEVAFPPPQLSQGVILSGGGAPSAQPEAKDPFILVNGSVHLAGVDRPPLIPEVPPFIPRDYAAEAEAALSEVTPEDVELNEILKAQGIQAMESRALEHQRNSRRRLMRKHFRANYARYVAEAKAQNIKRAAAQLLAQKQAAEGCPVQGREAALGGDLPTPIADASIPAPPAAAAPEDFPDTGKKPATNTPKSVQKAAQKTA
jgi:hypothetical protein